MNRLIVTGFGPFQEFKENPSEALARASGQPFQVLDVSYKSAGDFVACLDGDTFDVLLLLGLHGSAHRFHVEMTARNQLEPTEDVAGHAPSETEITKDGPEAIDGTLWPHTDLSSFVGDDTAQLSYDAGAYLCNYLYYVALRKFPHKRIGFLHVPHGSKMSLDIQHEKLKRLLGLIAAD